MARSRDLAMVGSEIWKASLKLIAVWCIRAEKRGKEREREMRTRCMGSVIFGKDRQGVRTPVFCHLKDAELHQKKQNPLPPPPLLLADDSGGRQLR